MQDHKFYFIGHDGRFFKAIDLSCKDDSAAIAATKPLNRRPRFRTRAARPPDRAVRRQAILNILRESGTVLEVPDVA
jgi:hypothetical protein